MINSGCGWTFHDHVAVPPDPLLSCLTSTREASHDALEMIKDLKKNPLALRGLMSAVELEESLELELCLTDIRHELLHVAIIAFGRMRVEERAPPTYHVMQISGCASL